MTWTVSRSAYLVNDSQERRTAAQWSAGAHAFSAKYTIVYLINETPFGCFSIDKASLSEILGISARLCG